MDCAHCTHLEWIGVKVAHLILAVAHLETLALVVGQVFQSQSVKSVEVVCRTGRVLNILALTVKRTNYLCPLIKAQCYPVVITAVSRE